MAASYWDLDDSNCNTGSPGCLAGDFDIGTIGVAFFWGASGTSVRMGQGISSGGGAMGGLGLGGYWAWGQSHLIDESRECCDVGRPPGTFMGARNRPTQMVAVP